jgi:2-C-methyl-D-erythritol 2,4-cyclodiphosphate synthase
MMTFRVGLGFDFHPFCEERRLVLGGIDIPHSKGLLGHSDADALLHAVTDAVLGAAGLDDIGTHFPDTDPKYKNIDSQELLDRAYGLVRGKGFEVGNVDIVVLAEEPRISPFVDSIKQSLSRLLSIRVEEIGIKATTMEGKGPIGRAEGVAVQAIVLLEKKG